MKNSKLFKEVVINKSELNKLKSYGKALEMITGDALECMGYLISYSNKKAMVNEVVYLLDQESSLDMVSATINGNRKTRDEIYKKGG